MILEIVLRIQFPSISFHKQLDPKILPKKSIETSERERKKEREKNGRLLNAVQFVARACENRDYIRSSREREVRRCYVVAASEQEKILENGGGARGASRACGSSTPARVLAALLRLLSPMLEKPSGRVYC